jgi:hypothetical protein
MTSLILKKYPKLFSSLFWKTFKGENRKLLDEGIGLVAPKSRNFMIFIKNII